MTALADIIYYLRTFGGSQGVKPDFSDQAEIVFFFDTNDTFPDTAEHRRIAEYAVRTWGELIDIPITIRSTAGPDDIRMFLSSDLDPGEAGAARQRFSLDLGYDIRIGPQTGFELGQFLTFVSLHEIGHALGLSHPGPYNGSQDLLYGRDNVYPEDNQKFTLMSYFGPFYFGDGKPDDFTGERTTTPLLHDIAAIQAIYGANTSTRTGDSVYGFNSNIEMVVRGETFRPYSLEDGGKSFAIWDAGGIDTIDGSGISASTSQTINLTPGTFSSIGAEFVEQANGSIRERPFVNNVTIAFGVTIENAIGGGGDDILLGNGARNVLEGRNGDDAMAGFGGDDMLVGGGGQDYLSGGADNDTLEGGASADQLFGESGSDLLIGGAFGDSLFGGDGFDIASYAGAATRIVFTPASTAGDISGDTFNSIEGFELTGFDDILHSFSGDETIWGFGGADEIRSFGGNDIVFGGGDNDSLFGGDGDDNLQGGEGNDQLEGGNGADQIDGGFGADTMTGGAGDDIYFVNDALDSVIELANIRTLSGAILNLGVDLVVSTLDFTLTSALENLSLSGFGLLRGTGSSLSNTITGNPSANVLDGRGGADILRGRGGNDTYIVDNALDVVDETTGGSADIDTVESSVTFSLANTATTLGSVENLTLTGTGAINGTGNALDNVLRGNNANNALTGSGGNDQLFGFAGDDSLSGGSGNDTMTGGAGNDKLNGSTGNDSYDFRTGLVAGVTLGADTITDSSGTDTLVIDSTSQIRSALRSGDDVIVTLTQGTVRITGQFAGSGIEQVQTSGGSLVMATSLLGGDASGIIAGTRLGETMDGRGGDDILFGGAGNDVMFGSAGNDRLEGGTGRDTLDGGQGDDLLIGGSGRDTFVFAPGYGQDTVADFEVRLDRLDLSGFDVAPTQTQTGAALVLDFGGGDMLTLNLKRPLGDGFLDSLA